MQNSSRAAVDIGSVVGAYTIEALIGRGGMGAVFVAGHNRLPGKKVAIKTLHADQCDKETLARFRHEAEAASRIGHPNIVQVIDFDELPDGTPYLVLEYLQGETLAHRLREGPVPLEQALSVVRQIGSALAAAHRAGVIHRDLKPGNIFLVPTEIDGRMIEIAKLLDFGISKITGSLTVKTQDSSLLGTPQYMSPEQATGNHTHVDERTDIFALGVILYEMLSGRPAFWGASIPEVVFKVVYENPTSLNEVAPQLPGQIRDAVSQAMAKPAQDRFPSVNTFIQALTGEPLATVRAGLPEGLAVPRAPSKQNVIAQTQVGVPSEARAAMAALDSMPVAKNTPTAESLSRVGQQQATGNRQQATGNEAAAAGMAAAAAAAAGMEAAEAEAGAAAAPAVVAASGPRGTALGVPSGAEAEPAPAPAPPEPPSSGPASAHASLAGAWRAEDGVAATVGTLPKHPQADVLTVKSENRKPEQPRGKAWLVALPIVAIAIAGGIYLATRPPSAPPAVRPDAQIVAGAIAADAGTSAKPDAAVVAAVKPDAAVAPIAHDAGVVAKPADAAIAAAAHPDAAAEPPDDADAQHALDQAEADIRGNKYDDAVKLAEQVMHSQSATVAQRNHAHGVAGEVACRTNDVGGANANLRALPRGAQAHARILRACKAAGLDPEP